MAASPVLTQEDLIKAAHEDMNQIEKHLKQFDSTMKAQQSGADAAADAARIERLKQKVNELMHGEDGKGNPEEHFMPMTDSMSRTSSGKSYENFKSSYQNIVRLLIALCYVLAAAFRTHHRLAGGFSQVMNIFSMAVSSIAGLLGATVEIHEDMLKASECSADGKVTINPLPTSLFSKGTAEQPLNDAQQRDLAKTLSTANEFMVRAFLMRHNYEPNDDGVYQKKEGTTIKKLTPEVFDRLKNDPEEGLKAFAEKHLPIKFTNRPMGPTGKQVPEPEPLSASSPRPK